MPATTATANTKPIADWQQVQIGYGEHTVLEALDFQWLPGQRIALLGKSGAGKSSFLKQLYQQLSSQPAAQKIGWIPQQLGLVDKLSSFHNVYIGQLDQHSVVRNLLNLLWPQRQPKKVIADLLERFELDHTLFTPVAQLSGGQQQRIAIARALYAGPDIILADEPVANLDGPMANTVINQLIQHSHSSIIALHDTELALAFATRIIGIKDGHIVLDQATDTLSAAQLDQLYEG
ncbi:ATP-binding cassette domain-containing protein [Oceanicoccus sp. KOV_DT_Chl]|uniref:ATP-binding cassette domain-containing protein n=1 Tax=Oceanicoccus sp. KOV_DT_Chl TaxID=1904639 RepID=UPI000C7E23DC|nr:ATP-binding cassette domain-containing protein [Oceanicoccus sp. KOV_DT_Chl]